MKLWIAQFFLMAAFAAESHWAFKPLPAPANATIDQLLFKNEKPAPEADRATLIRRVAFILTGLPPTPEEIQAFLSDRKSGAYERMADRYLSSARYGERWGKIWLDVAGYADSNGYFNADSERPLAWRYRDYVVRSFNSDKPFDQFIREQIAGDELANWKPGEAATPQVIELLEATHFMRNSQDGSGESDGNPDEVRSDRYYALESQMQIMGSSLLGLTVQCAKCHDHKFEPITQKDYYAFQAFLFPAYNIDKWTKPQDRVVEAHLPGELEAWKAAEKKLDDELAAAKKEFADWFAANRPAGKILFRDSFDGPSLRQQWSSRTVNLDANTAPAAQIRDGSLLIIEGGASGDRWISTTQSFNWKPAAKGEWIQATFDLIATKVDSGKEAERVGYFISLGESGIMIDGNPKGSGGIYAGYPASSKSIGETTAHHKPGRNYGARVTNLADDKFALEILVDGAVEGKAIELRGSDLPEGAFGFEYCCGRSFVVDNVVVETSNTADPEWAKKNGAVTERKAILEKATREIAARRAPKPGRIAWMTDASAEPPEVKLLKRGNHKTPGAGIEPAFPAFLTSEKPKITGNGRTTGRRLAWANWLTECNSPQSALLARVTVNRLWQNCFGVGLVTTPENFGLSGAKPARPELLEWLAANFARSGWKQKEMLRKILTSKAFRQQSLADGKGFPIQRLDAEAIRDAVLAVSGRLGPKMNGPFVPTSRTGEGEVVVDESRADAFARSIFLQHRRTQVPTLLATFDAPSLVFNCANRARTTMPLQSLSLLNSDFAVKRSEDFADRLKRECGDDDAKRIQRAFLLVAGRKPDAAEQKLAAQFIARQKTHYKESDRAWADFCQSLFASNHFLYLQ